MRTAPNRMPQIALRLSANLLARLDGTVQHHNDNGGRSSDRHAPITRSQLIREILARAVNLPTETVNPKRDRNHRAA